MAGVVDLLLNVQGYIQRTTISGRVSRVRYKDNAADDPFALDCDMRVFPRRRQTSQPAGSGLQPWRGARRTIAGRHHD